MKAKVKIIDGREITVYIFENHELKPGDHIEIKKKKPRRSLDQNALYWLLLSFAEKYLQMTPDEIHSGLKEAHLKEYRVMGNGDLFGYQQSTTGLDKVLFGHYLDKCTMTLIEFGVPCEIFWEKYQTNLKNWEK